MYSLSSLVPRPLPSFSPLAEWKSWESLVPFSYVSVLRATKNSTGLGMRLVFDLFCVCIDDGLRVGVGSWRGFKFSVS